MAKIKCLPDKRAAEINDSDTVLDALLAGGIDHTHVCGEMPTVLPVGS